MYRTEQCLSKSTLLIEYSKWQSIFYDKKTSLTIEPFKSRPPNRYTYSEALTAAARNLSVGIACFSWKRSWEKEEMQEHGQQAGRGMYEYYIPGINSAITWQAYLCGERVYTRLQKAYQDNYNIYIVYIYNTRYYYTPIILRTVPGTRYQVLNTWGIWYCIPGTRYLVYIYATRYQYLVLVYICGRILKRF